MTYQILQSLLVLFINAMYITKKIKDENTHRYTYKNVSYPPHGVVWNYLSNVVQMEISESKPTKQ